MREHGGVYQESACACLEDKAIHGQAVSIVVRVGVSWCVVLVSALVTRHMGVEHRMRVTRVARVTLPGWVKMSMRRRDETNE